MKLLIKFSLIVVILTVLAVCFFSRGLLEKTGSYFLKTDIKINRVKFVPHRLLFRARGIQLPEKRVSFSSGHIYLFPPKIELYGMNFSDIVTIDLNENNFSCGARASRPPDWNVYLNFQELPLDSMGFGVIEGKARGYLRGVYKASGKCDFYVDIVMEDVRLGEGEPEGDFSGVSRGDLLKIIETRGGNIELDFTFSGPSDKIATLYYYKPGKKTMDLLRSCLYFSIVPKFLPAPAVDSRPVSSRE